MGLRVAVGCGHRGSSWLSTRTSPATRPHTYLYTGLRMAGGVQAPRALVALDLRVARYATPYIGHRRVIQLRDPTHIHKAP